MGFKGIPDHRFEGHDNHSLIQIITGFRDGDAARAFGEAAYALKKLANGLAETDAVLREQLKQLGIDWQGAAGEQAATTVTASADYGQDADQRINDTSTGVMDQSDQYSSTRNGLPDPSTLQGDTQQNLVDKGMSLVGYETDHAKQVEQTNAARQQAVDALNNYSQSSQSTLDSFQPVGQPPNFELHTTASSADVGVAPVAGVGNTAGYTSYTGGQPSGVVGSPGVPGGGPVPSAPMPVGGPGMSPIPNPLPGGGNTTGVAPIDLPPGTTGTFGGNTPRPGGGGSNWLGLGLGVAGGVGLGAAAAGARGGRVVRGGGPPAVPVEGEEAAAAGKGAAAKGAGKGVGAASGVIGEEEELAGRSGARGGAAGKAGSSLTQPAAAGKGRKEEDEEHVRKYGVDESDVFDDDRRVVRGVLGDEDN